jgi:hypothetical protein
MTLPKNYLSPFSTSTPLLSLDGIANSASFFSGKWTPALKRNQSQQLLTLLITKFYWLCKENLFTGNPFQARTQASHAALAASLDLSREWTCKLVAVLRESGWIETFAPRRPDGKLREITIFRPGRKLKKLLIMLRESRQHHRVNDRTQKIPTKQDVEKNKARFAGLIEQIGKKLGMKT